MKLKRNKLETSDNSADLCLYLGKSHESARFTLQVVEQRSKGDELFLTFKVLAVIHFLFVGRRIEVLI